MHVDKTVFRICSKRNDSKTCPEVMLHRHVEMRAGRENAHD